VTDRGEYILVESAEAQKELPALLQAVMSGRRVRILEGGQIIAELLPPLPVKNRLQMHPDLIGVKFNECPVTPLSDEEWPESQRAARPSLGSARLLRATFIGDPVQLTTAEDWPEELRANVAPPKPAE
jgi:antitoxin (DNA-binding transcriptional repressor) of toxin-antitoxin stability system